MIEKTYTFEMIDEELLLIAVWHGILEEIMIWIRMTRPSQYKIYWTLGTPSNLYFKVE